MQRYPYRINPSILIFSSLLLAVMAWLSIGRALSNDRGLLINGVISLTASQATAFYWAAGVLCLVLVPWALLVILNGAKRAVVVGPETISVPKHAGSMAMQTVAFQDITGLDLQRVKAHRVLHIRSRGETIKLWDTALPSKAAFDAIVEIIRSRRQAAG